MKTIGIAAEIQKRKRKRNRSKWLTINTGYEKGDISLKINCDNFVKLYFDFFGNIVLETFMLKAPLNWNLKYWVYIETCNSFIITEACFHLSKKYINKNRYIIDTGRAKLKCHIIVSQFWVTYVRMSKFRDTKANPKFWLTNCIYFILFFFSEAEKGFHI